MGIHEIGDAELLESFKAQRSQAALSTLIERHGPAVHAAARRQLGDASLADDVTQAVFLVLMRKAGSIRRPELLAGWLMKVTRYCVLNARRAERRRTTHETRAAMMSPEAIPAVAAPVNDVRPLIDGAISKLGDVDRTVVTLSILESRPVEYVATALQMNPWAIRKRLTRAIKKLRASLSAAGVALSVDALALTLQQLPSATSTAFVPTMVTADVAGNSVAADIASATARQMSMASAKVAVLGVMAAVAVLGGAATAVWLNVATPPSSDIALPRSPEYGNVYSGDFATGQVGWSTGGVGRTPKGNKPFLGPFSNTETTLRITDLPKHDFVRVRADLYIIDTWDGLTRLAENYTSAGPDFWSLRIGGRSALVRTTISANPVKQPGFALTCRLQTYPNVLPSYPVPAGTAAYAVNELGYDYFLRRHNYSHPMDGEYRLDLTVPHTANTLDLSAAASNLERIEAESWGLANVKVDVLQAADVSTPTAEQLQSDWLAMTDNDAIAARDAFWRMIRGADATVAFLQRQTVSPGFNNGDVQRRIELLGSADPAVVFNAQQDLVAMGPGVEPFLIAKPELNTGRSPVVRRILEAIELRPIDSATARQAAAKAKLLATIDTPAARAAFGAWVATAPSWTPDWQRKFESDYRLPDGKALTYVRSPDRAARSKFINGRARLRASVENAAQPMIVSRYEVSRDAADVSMLLDLGGATPNLYTPVFPIYRQPSPDTVANRPSPEVMPEGALRTSIRQLINGLAVMRSDRTPWLQVMIDRDLRDTALPGDWVVSFNATQVQTMAALQDILSRELDKPVQIKVVKIEQTKTIIAGTPQLTPTSQPASGPLTAIGEALGVTRPKPVRSDTPKIDIYVDDADLATPSPSPARTLTLHRLITLLSERYCRPIELADPDQTIIDVVWHPAAITAIDRDDAALPANRQRVDQILSNVATQLGLKVEHAASPVTVYQMSLNK